MKNKSDLSSSRNKILGLIASASMIYSCAGECACTIPAWTRMVGNSSLVSVYHGFIGDKAVRGILRYDKSKKEFFGEFAENGKASLINVSGYMDSSKPSSPMTFNAYSDGQSNIAGRLYLKFPDAGFWINDKNEKIPYGDDCSDMKGEWISSDSETAKKVALGIDGEVNFPRSYAAIKNEETASKVRSDLLENNRRALASLLDYPLHVYEGRHFILASPEDVINNFGEVAIFSRQGLSNSIPHYLQSYGLTSNFYIDSGDIVIENGKVKRICITGRPIYCPLIDDP